jgi:transposase
MASIGTVVTIGVDPHPGSHTACALEANGLELGRVRVTNDGGGLGQLYQWAQQFRCRRWAIEGAGNRFANALVGQLLAVQEEVFSIPPSMTSQYRSRRGRAKDDAIDAANVARVLQANPNLPLYDPTPYESRLKELSRTYARVSEQLTANRMALESIDVPAAQQAMTEVIAALQRAAKTLKREMQAAVQATAPRLLDLCGVGPVVAATVLAETGRIRRFPNHDHFAAYAGCAPVRWQSGAHSTLRVNTGGNRTLNWAIYIMVINRLRVDPRTQIFHQRKLAQGKTQREVLRALKTYVARELYHTLRCITPCPHPN